MLARALGVAIVSLSAVACSREAPATVVPVERTPPPADVQTTPLVSSRLAPPEPVPQEEPEAPAAAPLPPGVVDQDVDAVREATFRHMFKKNASGQQQTAHVFCIELENSTPAPAAFVARFRNVKILVKSASACNPDTPLGVVDRATGGHGLIFRVDRVTFADADHAEVSGGYYEAGLSSSGNTYTLEKKKGKWAVVKDVMRWIS